MERNSVQEKFNAQVLIIQNYNASEFKKYENALFAPLKR